MSTHLSPLDLTIPGIDTALVYSIALRRRFRRIDVREGVLVHGRAGWGEISPFWDYDVAESARWFDAGIEAATSPFPPVRRDHVPVNATIPVCTPEVASALVRDGVHTVKVKVADPGVSLEADCARVHAVRQALGTAGAIRVDANAAWTPRVAITAIRALNEAAGGLEYVEQPCASVAGMREVRQRVQVPIAADESIRRSDDPLAVVRAGACDLIVTKVQPLGGVRAALDLADKVRVPVVVSSALDTSVGLAGGAYAAAALADLPYACGLGTTTMLTGDVTSQPLRVVAGAIAVRRVNVDGDYPAVASDVIAAWKRRLEDIMAWKDAQ